MGAEIQKIEYIFIFKLSNSCQFSQQLEKVDMILLFKKHATGYMVPVKECKL